ncbi:ATP-binding cassette superfamily, partial [Micromonas pusilla CCMP1545]
LVIRDLEYTPVGSGAKILTGRTSLSLSPRGLCLLVGRSGHGKSTLLTLVRRVRIHTGPHTTAGLAEPTGGVITFSDLPLDDHLPSALRNARVGIVFQFPERHFLGRTVLSELTFGWPTKAEYYPRRRELATRMQSALEAVGMLDVPLDTEVRSLSGGYKRRLALAIQLVRDPHVLCLDEPLAGLDWKARADVVALLDALRYDWS